jgi:probable phosphoglycerate mutase
VPLNADGIREAGEIGERLSGIEPDPVLTSPLLRASETCRIAGFMDRAKEDPDLVEWDYGEYEGITTAQIRDDRPGWSLFRDGAPGGEDAREVGVRADRVLERVSGVEGVVLVFAHGHVLRVLASRWLGLAPRDAALFALSTGSVSILGHERDTRVISLWNEVPGPRG